MDDIGVHEDFAPLSDFVGSLVSFIRQTEQDTHGVMKIASMRVDLPLECSVVCRAREIPEIYVCPPRRTHTGIEPVIHQVSIRVEADDAS
ncbi:MAG: hypothetical protein ACOCW2_00505 [Chitinivibrionales bacterium]